MKRTRIAAIDVGATKVCTIMADTNGNGNLRITGVGMAASRQSDSDISEDINDATLLISPSVKRAEKMAGYRLKSACVSISGRDSFSRNNLGVISIPHDNEIVRPADRKRVLELAQSVTVPDDQRLLHVIPRSYTLDGQENIKDPVGMHGFRLHADTHVVTAPAASVDSMGRCFSGLGICVTDLVLKSLASAEAVLTADETQTGVILVDIGGSTTSIAIFRDGSVFWTATIPVGGNHITNDIAVGLGLDFNAAEALKKEYGSVMQSKGIGDSDVAVTEGGCSISCNDLYEVIEARLEELFRLILLQLPQTDCAKTIPSGIVLTGGSCKLAGMVELANKITCLPVRIGTPHNTSNNDGVLRDPACSTCVGLLYWKLKNDSSPNYNTRRFSLHGLLPRGLGLSWR